jgi:ribonuclease HII
MKVIVGIDEVGRGCWAGPLVAGAVILSRPIAGLRDSKKLSVAQRSKLSSTILATSRATGLGWVSPEEIDTIGLTKAVGLAMQRALLQITIDYDQLIIDGNINYFSDNPRSIAVIKADDTIAEVSAASIIAKVARDAHMADIATLYPAYGFERHVGYGTKFHIDALKKYGVTPLHRKSYKPIKALL